jgi:hypothetical protein
MKNYLFIIFSLLLMSFIQDFNPQPKAITAKYFPEIEFEINTPAFKKEKGFTNHEELIQFLNDLKLKYPDLMTIQYIGESQKGKAIPMVTLSKKSNENKLKVWFQAGLHGDEMASTEGILHLLERLLNDPNYEYLLNKLELTIVPMANIDGYEKQDRYAANGLDLNRDQTKLLVKESVVLKQAFSNYNPDVGVDFHEYRPFRKEYSQLSTLGVASRYDVMFMSSGNLNVPEKLRKFTNEKFVRNAELELEKVGITHREYITSEKDLGDIHFNQGSISARSSATSYALANTVSSLIEIRGVGLGRTSFKRRIYSTFLVGISYLKTAYENVNEVKNVLKFDPNENQLAYIKCKKEISVQPLKFIDVETTNEINIEVEIRNASKSTPVLTRARPIAYLIDPSQKIIIEKLKILGISVEFLANNRNIEVECYSIKEVSEDEEMEEGVYQQKIKAEVQTKTMNFEKGTFIVYLSQENSNLAIEVLEPEAPNSFVNFGVLPANKDAILPIYRYLKNEKLY